MDLAEIVRVMRRRWYVLLPGLLLTAALTVGAYAKVPVTYQSQSTVVLLNSQKATKAFDGNPFLSTQISLNGMADSLARSLNSDAAVAHLRAQGASSTTVAKLADNAMGPLMWLTASGSDRRAVLADDRLMTRYAAEQLLEFQRQQAVTPQAMIRMATVVPPQNPVAQTKTHYEYLALAALLGIVVSLVAAFYVEARRRTPARGGARGRAARRAQGRPEPEPAADAGRPPAADAPAPAPDPEPRAPRPPARHVPHWSMDARPEPGAEPGHAGPEPDGRVPDGRVPDGVLDGRAPAGPEAAGAEAPDSGTTGSAAHRYV